jgi:NTE family protein
MPKQAPSAPALKRRPAAQHSSPPKRPRIALALAGGGPLGAIYEIGALCALQESIDGLDFTRLDHYIGVSAGGFIAAALANGMGPREQCASFIENDKQVSEVFDPAWMMTPAWGEFVRRAFLVPGVTLSALERLLKGKSLTSVLEQLGPALPTGVFSNDEIDHRLALLFSKPGRSNDFRELQKKRGARLTLVATDLDSGDAAPFGRPGWDHVPISKAVQASSALPGMFPPVEIDDHYYVDGALKKTMHASLALDEGVDLMLCLNPLVPFDATAPQYEKVMHRGLPSERHRIPRIVEGGLPSVMAQTFRSMIHSRLELGMKQYERSYPHSDVLLFEPDHRDPEMYLANTFSYSQRRHLAEHAYQQTRAWLRSRRTTLSATLARHGLALNLQALDDHRRHLVKTAKAPTRIGRAVQRLQEQLDDLQAVTEHAHFKG